MSTDPHEPGDSASPVPAFPAFTPSTLEPAATEYASISPSAATPESVVALRRQIVAAGVTDTFEVRLLVHVLQSGRLSSADLQRFVSDARDRSPTITDYVLSIGVADEADLVAVSAQLNDMPTVDLVHEPIEEAIVELLRPEQAQEWNVLPFARDDFGSLLVAIADPNDLNARAQTERAMPHEKRIAWRLAAPSALRTAIERYYSTSTTMAVVSEDDELEEQVLTTIRGEQDSGIVRLVNDLISKAKVEQASDIHIEQKEAETVVRLRVDGILRDIAKISKKDTPKVISRIKTMTRTMRTDWKHVPQDGRIRARLETGALDLRVTSVPTRSGEKIVLRLLDPKQAQLSLEELGMTGTNLRRYLDAISLPHGCAILTGPTGSGKSTTLYSTLHRVYTPERSIFTIEDPVEYQFDDISQIDVSGQGEMSMTFPSALRAIMRADPDTIMVGEIRDSETAKIAIEAALTGHFLFSTLHTNDAVEAIGRLQRLGVEPFLIATALKCVVAQRLLRRLCPTCKVEDHLDAAMLSGMRAPEWAIRQAAQEPIRVFRPKAGGCNTCRGEGYRGRVGIHEVVLFTDEIVRAIIQGRPLEDIKQIAREQGMGSLRDDAIQKVLDGVTSVEQVAQYAAG
jgi:type II secretory ATPase GspE/PulE/Tfp pilus assembly ATPase PilB-like protein